MAVAKLYDKSGTRPIEAHRPTLSKEELQSVLECLIEDKISSGDIARRFERTVASAFGFRHVLAVNSLASAYHLAFLALGIEHGKTVLMSALSSQAACDAARYTGASVRLIDVDRNSFHPPVKDINDTVERVDAFVLEHTFGSLSPVKIDSNLNIPIIEDFTGLAGNEQETGFTGISGQIGICGLSEYDLLTTGNGALIVTQDQKLFKMMQSLRYGNKRDVNSIAYDYGLEDFQAAMGIDQLSRLSVTLSRRKKIGQKYLETLRLTKHETYFQNPGIDSYLRFPVVINKPQEEVKRYFDSLQIGISKPVQHPLHHLLGLPALEYPNAERIFRKSIGIPLYPTLSANNVDRICSSIRGII